MAASHGCQGLVATATSAVVAKDNTSAEVVAFCNFIAAGPCLKAEFSRTGRRKEKCWLSSPPGLHFPPTTLQRAVYTSIVQSAAVLQRLAAAQFAIGGLFA